MSFIVFLLIIALTAFQRWLMREKDPKVSRRVKQATGVAVSMQQGSNAGGLR